MKKNTKKALITVSIFSAAAAATYLAVGNAFYYITLTKKGLNSTFIDKYASPNNKEDDYTKHLNNVITAGADWFNAADREKLVIRSSSNKKNLHADYIFTDKPSSIYVLLVHGYTSSPENMGIYAKKYHEVGYNVILPSLNGHADSESDIVTMGWDDRLDVIDWANYIAETNPSAKIIIHGVSMGAATTMMATGEELPKNVITAVADCGYTSVWDIFSNKLNNGMNLPDFPILYSANTVNKAISKFDFKNASSVEQLKKSKTPTIFIHGEKDTFVPYPMLDKVYDACAAEKEKVTIPNAPHARNACADPELYWSSILKFIRKHL